MAIPKDISHKKSFILYNDQVEIINELSDKQAGQLFKTLYQYSSSGKVGKITDSGVKIAFIAIKSQIDRDSIKYTQVCEKNRENINKRWKDKHTTVYDRIRPDTKHTDTDNDTDNDKDKDKRKFNEKEFLVFYSTYPNHTGKKEALERWKKLLKTNELPELSIILTAIKKQISWRENTNGEFRPEWKHPATWLNKGCWEDEIESPKQPQKIYEE